MKKETIGSSIPSLFILLYPPRYTNTNCILVEANFVKNNNLFAVREILEFRIQFLREYNNNQSSFNFLIFESRVALKDRKCWRKKKKRKKSPETPNLGERQR